LKGRALSLSPHAWLRTAGEAACIFLYFDYHRNIEETIAIQSLAALAQAMRLRVFRSLVVAGPQGRTPGQLAEELEVAGATCKTC
jgi:hypothetical protein